MIFQNIKYFKITEAYSHKDKTCAFYHTFPFTSFSYLSIKKLLIQKKMRLPNNECLLLIFRFNEYKNIFHRQPSSKFLKSPFAHQS